MHMRWAKLPKPGDDYSPLFSGNLRKPTLHDDPKHNWLGVPYSAHVNPVFWKLHGLVDHVIELWLSANGFEEIANDCKGRPGCYQWKTQWVGAPMEADMGTAKAHKHTAH